MYSRKMERGGGRRTIGTRSWTLAACFFVGVVGAGFGQSNQLDLGRGVLTIQVPQGYSAEEPAPLVVLLHGFTASGQIQESYMRFGSLVDEFGFLYVYPDGLVNANGERFWNGTDACCAFGLPVDDSAYLRQLILGVQSRFNVDPRRIYFIGHSNGGFMSYRMACENSDLIAAIASLAGATFNDPLDCAPEFPVHVLQIHGTDDQTILFEGGLIANIFPYPGAIETARQWALYNGCELTPDNSQPPRDLDRNLVGAETTVRRYTSGCNEGGSTELWTIQDGVHVPALSATFSRQVIEYLYAHPKPESFGPPLATQGWPAYR